MNSIVLAAVTLAMIALAGCAGGAGGSAESADPAKTLPAESDGTSANRWQLRAEHAPNTMWENGIAYDPLTSKVVFYGGHVGRLYPQSNYTFLYDLDANRFTESQALVRPQRRCLVHVAYIDSLGLTATTDGGISHGSIAQRRPNKDATRLEIGCPNGPWLYDSRADAWIDCRTVGEQWQRRAHAAIAYDPSSDALFHLTKDRLQWFSPWTNQVHSRPLPEGLKNRLGYGIAVDPIARKLVVFGGTGGGGYIWQRGMSKADAYAKLVAPDTWVYDIVAGQWHRASPKLAPPRGIPMHSFLNFQMVYHGGLGKIVLMQNGIDHYEPDASKWAPSQLWAFDAADEQWTRLQVENPPPFMGLLTYDADRDLLILFGGGRDCVADDGKTLKPALSRQVWTCRLDGGETGAHASGPAAPQASFSGAVPSFLLTRGQSVYRAEVGPDDLPGPFVKIVDCGDEFRKFDDESADPTKPYAYRIQSRRGGQSSSLFSRPVRPEGLVASVESANRVVLRWPVELVRPQRLWPATPPMYCHVYRVDGPPDDVSRAQRLTDPAVSDGQFVDTTVDLSDGVIRSYWITQVGPTGLESGPSPIAYSMPEPVAGLTVYEGVAPSNGVGQLERWAITWRWPSDAKLAGFNIYHADRHMDTLLEPGGYEAFLKLWTKLNDQPITDTEFIFDIPKTGGPHHYFYVRPVNVLGQEGLSSDIVSPTDRRFRP